MIKTEFTKNNSLALKGIAIMMMVFHHCYASADRYVGIAINFAPFGEQSIYLVSNSCKMCISLYAFVTGYGLFLSLKKIYDREYVQSDISHWCICRYIKTMSGFWVIAVPSFVICQLIDGRTANVFFEDTTLKGIFKGVAAIGANLAGVGDLLKLPLFCDTWWYMSLAVVFIFAAPLFVRLILKYNALILLVFAFAVPRVFKVPYNANAFFSFLFIYLLGMLCAKHNWLVKIANLKFAKSVYVSKLVKFAALSALIVLLLCFYQSLSPKRYFEFRFAVLPFVLIVYFYEFFLDVPYLSKILEFFGKHSMNIFLIHTFFRAFYLHDFVYSGGYWFVAPVLLFAISLSASLIVEGIKKIFHYDKWINRLLIKISEVSNEESHKTIVCHNGFDIDSSIVKNNS